MKKIFTLLLGTLLTLCAFSQAPKTVLYLTSPVPFATGANMNDQIMFDLIEGLGYIVTAEQLTAGGTTAGYDVIFASEAPPSGDGGWSTYSDAPLPMVMAKVWATKSSALGWITTENGGVDYANSPDSMYVAVDDEHEITTNLPDPLKIISASGEADNAAWVNAADYPSGAAVVYSTEDDAAQHTVVAIDQGTTLNGHTLASPVVIVGIHQNAYDALTDDVPALIDNCLKWAMGIEIEEKDPAGIIDNTIINTTVYPNPSNGVVNLKFSQYVTSAQVTITALDGRTVRTSDIYNAESASLDYSDLSSGIYILNISGKNINYTQSISLQN